MIARLRSAWFAIKASYWFFPALFSLAAFALALGLVDWDATHGSAWLGRSWLVKPARPDIASNMLQLIAGSMIGVAATVFSITIAAVAYASGTYGPRLLNNFMEDRGNQLSLATFLGTAVYALTALHAVRSPAPDGSGAFVPQQTLLVAYVFLIVSVAVLVYFLHHVPSSIRIDTVLEGIGRRLLATIASRFPEEAAGEVELPEFPGGEVVLSHYTGYVRVTDFPRLAELARKYETCIALSLRTGDFVHVGSPLARFVPGDFEREEIAGGIRGCFALGASRTPEQDLEFSIDELVEIALRALSPGVNDPFTAITALHWLGAATAELGRRDLRPAETGEGRLLPLPDDFAHFVARGLGAMRGALATNRIALLVALDTIRAAATSMPEGERRGLLAAEGRRLMQQAELALVGPDFDDVQARYREFLVGLAG